MLTNTGCMMIITVVYPLFSSINIAHSLFRSEHLDHIDRAMSFNAAIVECIWQMNDPDSNYCLEAQENSFALRKTIWESDHGSMKEYILNISSYNCLIFKQYRSGTSVWKLAWTQRYLCTKLSNSTSARVASHEIPCEILPPANAPQFHWRIEPKQEESVLPSSLTSLFHPPTERIGKHCASLDGQKKGPRLVHSRSETPSRHFYAPERTRNDRRSQEWPLGA